MGADYALFSFYRDFQASGGRMAFAFVAAMAGVGMIENGDELYVLMYLGADPYYFDKTLPDATKQIQSARLRT